MTVRCRLEKAALHVHLVIDSSQALYLSLSICLPVCLTVRLSVCLAIQTLTSYVPVTLQDVARFCNRYPNIELSFEVHDKDNITA